MADLPRSESSPTRPMKFWLVNYCVELDALNDEERAFLSPTVAGHILTITHYIPPGPDP